MPRKSKPLTGKRYSHKVARLLRDYREELGETGAQCAARAGVHETIWYAFERGSITLDRLPLAAKGVRCEPWDLLPKS